MYSEYKAYSPIPATARVANDGLLTPTNRDIEGPFYKAGAPLIVGGVLATAYVRQFVKLTGCVMDTHGKPIDALLDFWQANSEGVYDNEGFNCRGKIVAKNGSYTVESIMPGDYEIGPGEYRCAHLHAKVWVDGVCRLTTQIYWKNRPHDDTDKWFDATRAVEYPVGMFDFVLK